MGNESLDTHWGPTFAELAKAQADAEKRAKLSALHDGQAADWYEQEQKTRQITAAYNRALDAMFIPPKKSWFLKDLWEAIKNFRVFAEEKEGK
jgi:hypothetical protein